MKKMRRRLSLLCVVVLVLAITIPTVFAATTGYLYTYGFSMGTGGTKIYNGKSNGDLWYPTDVGAATWSVDVNGSSITYVSSATLYYIRSFGTDPFVTSMASVSVGGSGSKPIVVVDGKTYYAVINAATNEGVYGTTTLYQ